MSDSNLQDPSGRPEEAWLSTTKAIVVGRTNTFSAPPENLREACEGWIKIGMHRNLSPQEQERAPALHHLPVNENDWLFDLGSDACCAICWTLTRALSIVDLRHLPWSGIYLRWKVRLSRSDHEFVEIFGIGDWYCYRFVIPPGKTNYNLQCVCRLPTC